MNCAKGPPWRRRRSCAGLSFFAPRVAGHCAAMSERPKNFSQPEWRCPDRNGNWRRARASWKRVAISKAPSARCATKRTPTADPFSSASLPSTKATTPPLTGFGINLFLPADLTPNGVLALCQIHLRRQDFAAVKQILAGLSDAQLRECPYFLFFRGIVRFAAVLSRPEQGVALTGLPLDARLVQPILPDQQLEIELDAAHSDLERFLSASEGLELREAPRLAEAYLTWCDLLHPRRRDAALIQLRSDMADPAKALSRVQFALAYDADNFDREPLTKYLEKREALGGLNSDELRAALVLRLHADDPGAIVAAYCEASRAI